MLAFAALTLPFRFVNGWLYNRTGSLFLVGLMHAAGNAVAGGSGFQTGLLAHLYPDEGLPLLAHPLAFAILGLLVVIATRGRLGSRRAPDGTRRLRARKLPRHHGRPCGRRATVSRSRSHDLRPNHETTGQRHRPDSPSQAAPVHPPSP
jgi:hypothetical protein